MTTRSASQIDDQAGELREVLAEVNDRVGLSALVSHARQEGSYCCPDGCGSGACETCPCCCAGWCVSGTDGVPKNPGDFAQWVVVAAEYNPVAAELARYVRKAQR